MDRSTLRVGVVGVGNIGFVHATHLFQGKISGTLLAGLCDRDPQVREALAQAFPDVPLYEEAQEMFCRGGLDAVIVSVPHPIHADIAIAAFQAGLHVLLEKPMDISLTKGLALCDAARASGRQFSMMLNQRCSNLFAQARQILRSGQLGTLKRSVWIVTNWYRTQHYYRSATWRATWAGEGGGVLMNQAPHQLDIWQWICGMPECVTAFCREGKYHPICVEDEATLLVRFPGGGEGVFITSTGEYPGTNRLEITGTLGKLVLENGVMKWWQLEQDEETVRFTSQEDFAQIPTRYREFPEIPDPNTHATILQNFCDSVRLGTPLLISGYDGIHELTLQNAAYLSAWKGSVPVELPFDREEYDRLLRQKQQQDAAQKTAVPSKRRETYDPRWQIRW